MVDNWSTNQEEALLAYFKTCSGSWEFPVRNALPLV
jgi:hypothetical protein